MSNRFSPGCRLAGLRGLSVNKVKTFGLENLPEGGFLLLPNDLTGLNAVVLQNACPRPIRFSVNESIYRIEWHFFRSIDAIPMPNVWAQAAVREAAERICQGEIVCIFSEAELGRSETLIRLSQGFELVP